MEAPASWNTSPDLSLTLTLLPTETQTTGAAAHHHASSTSSTGSSPTAPLPLKQERPPPPPEERGIRLIQLLITCAHHVYKGGAELPLADYCLRLITPMTSPTGDSMQRLASRMAAALSARLLRQLGCLGALSAIRRHCGPAATAAAMVPPGFAHLSFSRILPYLPFCRAVAASALLRAVAGYRLIHIVQLGRPDPDLLAQLLLAFARLPMPPAHVRFTCVPAAVGAESSIAISNSSGKHHIVSLDQLVGSALAKEAESLGVPFSFRFQHVALPLDQYLADAALASPQQPGDEALAFVSVLTLHTLLAAEGRLDRTLSSIHALRPKAVVAVEQDCDLDATLMPDRFAKALHHYGALFDSVDSAAASGLMAPDDRVAVEDMLGEELENVVACEGGDRVERHQTVERWVARFRSSGFVPLGGVLWAEEATAEGRRAVEAQGFAAGTHEAGYGVVVRRGCPTICWHGRPMYAVSAWST